MATNFHIDRISEMHDMSLKHSRGRWPNRFLLERERGDGWKILLSVSKPECNKIVGLIFLGPGGSFCFDNRLEVSGNWELSFPS